MVTFNTVVDGSMSAFALGFGAVVGVTSDSLETTGFAAFLAGIGGFRIAARFVLGYFGIGGGGGGQRDGDDEAE